MVNAGQIVFNGSMNLVNGSFTSLASIMNGGAPVDLVTSGTVLFNALGGDVGSSSSPILVHTLSEIFAGGIDFAYFAGSSSDDTVHAISSNPPCVIVWNGVVIKDCGRPTPPTPIEPSSHEVSSELPVVVVFRFATPIPGVENSWFTLANDLFFKPFFIDEHYLRHRMQLYWSAHKSHSTANSSPVDRW